MHAGAHRKFILDQDVLYREPSFAHLFALWQMPVFNLCLQPTKCIQVAKYVYTMTSYKYYGAETKCWYSWLLVKDFGTGVLSTRYDHEIPCTWCICHHGVSQKQVWNFKNCLNFLQTLLFLKYICIIVLHEKLWTSIKHVKRVYTTSGCYLRVATWSLTLESTENPWSFQPY